MHYDEAGSGPPVVLLHGFPLDRRMWTAQREGLSDRFRVITPDLRGFGESRDETAFTVESLADDLNVFLRTINALPCVLGGLSMGGYVCFAYYRKHAGTVMGLMLINTRPEADPPAVKEHREKTAQQALSQGAEPVVQAMLPRLLSPKSRRPDLITRTLGILRDCPARTIANASLAMRDRPDSTQLLKSISVPTLIIAGADDPIIAAEIPRQMQANISGARLTMIPGAAHLTPMEQAPQVNRAMREFVTGIV